MDPGADKHAAAGRVPLSRHLDDYAQALAHKGSGDKHVRQVKTYAARLLDLRSVEYVADLAPSVVADAIGELKQQGLSSRTLNAHLVAIKGFSRWMVRDGRMATDPLVHMQRRNAKADVRRRRRVLTPEELRAVVAAAERGPVACGVPGADRAALYRLAAGTGFRAGELASLTPESFDLDTAAPAVTVQAGFFKRRRDDTQPIRHDLAGWLRVWLAGKPKGQPVFNALRLSEKTAKMIRADLQAAGVPYADDAGRVADFHSLRGLYITAIVQGGASVKTAMTLARHSSAELTVGVYSHARLHELTGALDALPDLDNAPERDGLRATGTDAQDTQQIPQQSGHETVQPRAAGRNEPIPLCEDQGVRKSTDRTTISDAMREDARGCDQATCRTRTDDLLFTRQLLYQLS